METMTLRQSDLKLSKKHMPDLSDGLVRVFDNRIFIGKKEVKHKCKYPFQVMMVARTLAGYNPDNCDDDEFPILT